MKHARTNYRVNRHINPVLSRILAEDEACKMEARRKIIIISAVSIILIIILAL